MQFLITQQRKSYIIELILKKNIWDLHLGRILQVNITNISKNSKFDLINISQDGLIKIKFKKK